MKIGVISDTHLKGTDPLLERVIEKHFKEVDLIFHAGDFTSSEVLGSFRGKKIVAVAGNNDSSRVKQRLPEKEVIAVNGFKIGLIHGWGLPLGLEKRVTYSFEEIHCLVYGHSHRAVNHRRNGILYFNPGAFSGGLCSLWRRSVGLLTIDRGIQGEIISL
ncbi:MAG: metallophosphoesterase [Deltaproteobacteria bacterium]|nr:metallophosphoesterase [Deltaproteobacteria bacterium]